MASSAESVADRIKAARRRLAPAAKILTIDIEWRPMVVYTWGMWQQNHHIEQIIDDGGMLCFAAKWLGSKDTIFHDERGDRLEMLAAAHELMSEADIVITYNGERYDIPKLNQEFMLQGWAPPAPFKSVDLLKTNKRRFDLPSRKLQYLGTRTGMGSKTPHTGFELWTDCIKGDSKAWALMEKYNRQDVVLTERVYLRLLPWLVDQPHIGVFTGDKKACTKCTSSNLTQVHKRVHAFVQTYSLFRCEDCLSWNRDVFKLQTPNFTRPVR